MKMPALALFPDDSEITTNNSSASSSTSSPASSSHESESEDISDTESSDESGNHVADDNLSDCSNKRDLGDNDSDDSVDEFPEFSTSDAQQSRCTTDINEKLFGAVSDDSSNQSNCKSVEKNATSNENGKNYTCLPKESNKNADCVVGSNGEAVREQPLKVKFKIKHTDKFSAMKALIFGDDVETSGEDSLDSQPSECNTPLNNRIIKKPDTIGKPAFSSATRKLFETTSVPCKTETKENHSPEADSSKSDEEDVVFVSIGDRSDGTSKEPVVIPDTDSDSDDDVVIVRTEKLKHKGVGKKSKKESEKTDIIVCGVSEGNSNSFSDGNCKKTVDTSGLSLVSDNTDNNLVYPQVPASDSCMCDVFGMGAFGCADHAPRKVENPVRNMRKEFDNLVNNLGAKPIDNIQNELNAFVNKLSDKPSSSAIESDTLAEVRHVSNGDQTNLLHTTKEQDSSQEDSLPGQQDQTNGSTKEICLKNKSPLLDMPVDFSSFFDKAKLSECQTKDKEILKRSQSIEMGTELIRTESKSSISLSANLDTQNSLTGVSNKSSDGVIEVSSEHTGLARSTSLPLGKSDLKRKGDSGEMSSGKVKKLHHETCVTCLSYVSTKKVIECMGGHIWCCSCIEVLVKTLLTAGTKGSLKCGMHNCENYFPTGQLQRVLPPMIVDVLQKKFDEECLSMIDDELVNHEGQSVQVKLVLGHRAVFRDIPTEKGFTHDWAIYVCGHDNNQIQPFVEKVVFHLHGSFSNPKRVVKDPPYEIRETGYAGFLMHIDVYFKNMGEPRKLQFKYDLFLNSRKAKPVDHTRCEILTFQNPQEEFRRRLIKGGGVLQGEETSAPSDEAAESQAAEKKIQRNQNLGLPLNWDELDENEDYKMVDLIHGTVEYLDVVNRFYETMKYPRASISKIQRVQNPTIWQFYSMKMKHMEKRLGDNGINEQKLFHGTRADLVESICTNNFDWRMCGENGTSYGQGSYFARDASYSHRYTDNNGRNALFGQVRMLGLPPPLAHQFSNPHASRPPAGVTQMVGHPSVTMTHLQHFIKQLHSSGYQKPPRQNPGVHAPDPNQPSTSSVPVPPPRRSAINMGSGDLGHILKMRRNTQLHNYPSLSGNLPPGPNLNPSQGTGSAFHPVSSTNTMTQPTLNQISDPQFVEPKPEKTKHTMFLCRVLCGKFTLGRHGYRIPPPIDGSNPTGPRFDTCVDNIISPNIYVVFERAQCYPDYVIYYENVPGMGI